jgi:DNA-binding LacI/PurR family transcriptional regulator
MPKAFIKRTASQQLAEQIHRQIEQGTWAAGDPMPSMRKLATKYHVSLATVQRAMQELGDRDIIKLLPRQGGIVQSISTAGNRTKNQIGVVVGLDPSIHIPLWWSQQIIHHAQMVLAESGYVLTLFNYMVNKPDYARQVSEQMSGMKESLAGMFFFADSNDVGFVEVFNQADLPWMSVNPVGLDTHYNYVMADQLAAGRLVGRCFAKMGYERVAVVYDDLVNLSPLEKVTGIYQGYLIEGVSSEKIVSVRTRNMETDAGYVAMRQYLANHQPPQGIFATSDTLAVGAMRACQEIGLRIPQDVGVVGSTGLPSSMLQSDPPLTELRQPVEGVGSQLALCILEMIRGDLRQISGRRVPSTLILNESLAIPDSIRRELGIDPVVVDEPTAQPQSAQLVSMV